MFQVNAEKISHTFTFGCYLNLFLRSINILFFLHVLPLPSQTDDYLTERFLNVCTTRTAVDKELNHSRFMQTIL